MLEIRPEALTDHLIDELTPILEAHRQELQSYPDMILNPAWEIYKLMQDLGKTMFLVARDDGVIVGYCMYIISANMHYRDFVYAIEDVFYVVKDHRGSKIAIKLIRTSEDLLSQRGVDVITHHAKFTNNFKPFLEKLGYTANETMMMKRLSKIKE